MKHGHIFKEYYDIQPPAIFKAPVGILRSKEEIAAGLLSAAKKEPEKLLQELGTSENGLTHKEAVWRREEKFGPNEIVHEERAHWVLRLLLTFKNPLTLLLLLLVLISYVTGDIRSVIVIFSMVLISVLLQFIQEEQAYNAADKLRSLVKTTCAVIRGGRQREVDIAEVVPGDIVALSAGDIVPADLRILQSKDLFINQSLLTGEALPVEKHAFLEGHPADNPLELINVCYSGTNVETGSGLCVAIDTGSNTYFGSLAKTISGVRGKTSFDKGIDRFTWLMIRFMGTMVPIVFLVNGLTKGTWWEAFLFAISVAVGLTPEMLPAIVAINLSQGAVKLSRKKVIVKRLNSIQNFGAMDVLCTDKTGTLTQNNIVLIKHVNIDNEEDEDVFRHAYWNSVHQSGFRNLLDSAILKHSRLKNYEKMEHLASEKIDEIPFDFKRKRLSIILDDRDKKRLLVCKGAVEEVLSVCHSYSVHHSTHELTPEIAKKITLLNEEYAREGFRVIAIAYKHVAERKKRYSVADESHLTFLGLMTFLDPPKESTAPAIRKLEKLGIAMKVLTGDNELVTKKICSEVGLPSDKYLLGSQIEKMSAEELGRQVEDTVIFAKLSPDDKKRIVISLQKNGHAVGFLGDGINDAPALRTADVGVSVDGAVDIAKESADIILLEKSLTVLADGVEGGRRVFANIMKYIKMGSSSNFGNMFSVLGASMFLPFLPMTPIQVLSNNLLYDISQLGIPTDHVDRDYVEKPRQWRIDQVQRFMLFIGPISSVFDYATFFLMLFVFKAWHNPALFQTGWFVESLLSQTLIVHMIRSPRLAFIQTRASAAMMLTTFSVMAIGILIVFSPLAPVLGFVRLPAAYWAYLLVILLGYVVLTQAVKMWYIRKYGFD
jgi:Mg2+-importing ATPase